MRPDTYPSREGDGSRSFWLRVGLLGTLGAVLIWQIITRSLAAHLALVAPDVALSLRPGESTALLSLADTALNRQPDETEATAATTFAQPALHDGAQTPQQGSDRLGGWAEIALKALAEKLPLDQGQRAVTAAQLALTQRDREQIRTQAQLALLEDPINARALRILGQLADVAGDDVRATSLMHAAADRSLGESIAVYWMLQQSAKKKDYASTVSYADVFLRKRPQLVAHAMPMLAQLAESADPKAVAELEKMLATDPPWRSAFFSALLGAITDARTPLNLLLKLKDTPTPPTTADLNAYLSFLIGHKFYELAYYSWLQFLPADELGRVGLLANGSFEVPSSGLPFDWVLAMGSGVTVDVTVRPDAPGQHALFLEFGPGRVEFPGITQMLLLPAGSYHFKGKLKGEVVGHRGLQWRVLCAGASAPPIGESEMFVGLAPTWSDFEFNFTVPNKDCRAQQLRLDLASRSASEQLVSGSLFYDDLIISRSANDPEATPASDAPAP